MGSVSKKTTVSQQPEMPQQEQNQSDPLPASESAPGLGEEAGQATDGLLPVGREVASLLSPFEKQLRNLVYSKL